MNSVIVDVLGKLVSKKYTLKEPSEYCIIINETKKHLVRSLRWPMVIKCMQDWPLVFNHEVLSMSNIKIII